MRGILSLRIELDKVIVNEDYEKLVFENLERCHRLVGNRFYVIFWHTDLNKKEIEDFAIRNKDKLFEFGTKITSEIGDTWFLIKSSEKEKSTWRYMHDGNILEGIVEYLKIVNHMYKRDNIK